MQSDLLFTKRFNAIPSEYINATTQDRAVRIFNHYLTKVQSGMRVGPAIDRATRDLAGDNYHPAKPQRSGITQHSEA